MSDNYTAELRKVLISQGATLRPYHDIWVADSFGNPAVEIESCKSTAGICHIPSPGLIKCTGTDVLDLLQRMSTNNVSDLQDFQQTPTILTTENGRIIDILYLFSLNSSVYIICSPNNEDKVIYWLEKYTFMEDARFQSISPQNTFIQIAGPKARDLIKTAFESDSLVTYNDVLTCKSKTIHAWAINLKINSNPTYLIITSNTEGAKTWKLFTEFGAIPVGFQAFEISRVLAGIPALGKEITEKTNPLEIGAIGAIDFAKGCYIGQEVIARLDTYKKVQKRLVVLDISGAT